MKGEMNIMKKMSKKLYVVLAVVLCIGIAFVVCITPSDASDGKIPKQVNQQNTPEEVSQQKEKSEDYRQDNGEEVVLVSESEKSAQTADKVKKTPPKDTEKEVVNDSGKSTDKAQQSNTTDKKDHETSKEKDEIKETVTHTHKWEPVYAQKKIEKTRQVAWTKCYACGADMTGNISHIDQHLLNHETNVHYGTEYRIEVYYETESYISGYKCSCGKTK